MKSYTDLEQSKKLAEILPIQSADMWYGGYNVNDKTIYNERPDFRKGFYNNTPCWSLAALLSVIPQEIFNGEYIINITEGLDNKWIITYDYYGNRNHSFYRLSSGADNLVDSCVDLLIKLKERNII